MTTPPTSLSSPSLAGAVTSLLRIGSPRRNSGSGSPRVGSPRIVTSASSPAVSTQNTPRQEKLSDEEERLRQRDLLYAFFYVTHHREELSMLKGHLRNVTLSPEYSDQILRVFMNSLYQDEKEYERRKTELLKALTGRAVGGFEEYYKTTFTKLVKDKYKIDLLPLTIPDQWENGKTSYQLPQACIKTALIAHLIRSYPTARIEAEELFKLRDYEIWQYIDGETAASGGNRSHLSTFCSLVNQVFLNYIHITFTVKGEDLRARLRQKPEYLELYLTYKLGECNGALIAMRSFARRITFRLEQKEDCVRARCSSSKRPSSVILEFPLPREDECLSPRAQSGSKLRIKHPDEETRVETPRGKQVLDGDFFNFSRYSFPLSLSPDMLHRLPQKMDDDHFHAAYDFASSYRTALENLKETIEEVLDLFVKLYPLEVPEKVTPEVRKHIDHLGLIKHYSNMHVNCLNNQLNFIKEKK